MYRKKVNIINLSLGVVADIEKCTELKRICIEAYNRGIFIFSAENNHGLTSYPCNFSTVVKITSFNSPCSSELLILDKNDKSLNFLYFILNLCAKFSLKSQPSIYGKYGKWIL